MRPTLSLLLVVFLLSGLTACIPHTDQPLTARVKKPALLAEGELISEVRLIFGQAKEDDTKTTVFELAGNRISKEMERLLRKAQRWNEQDGLVLYVEIEKVHLRKTLFVLILRQLIKDDEISVKLWITKDGAVVASETLTTFYDAGGMYNTLSPKRRIELLSDQIARKMVNRL